MDCPSCGKPVQAEAYRCRHCGAALKRGEDVDVPRDQPILSPAVETPETYDRGRLRNLRIGGWALLLLASPPLLRLWSGLLQHLSNPPCRRPCAHDLSRSDVGWALTGTMLSLLLFLAAAVLTWLRNSRRGTSDRLGPALWGALLAGGHLAILLLFVLQAAMRSLGRFRH